MPLTPYEVSGRFTASFISYTKTTRKSGHYQARRNKRRRATTLSALTRLASAALGTDFMKLVTTGTDVAYGALLFHTSFQQLASITLQRKASGINRRLVKGVAVMTETRALAIQKQQSLQQLAWEEIKEPGAYVEIATGTLYRVPKEALLKGTGPSIRKHGAAGSQVVKVSEDPFIFSLAARMVCVEHNIRTNF